MFPSGPHVHERAPGLSWIPTGTFASPPSRLRAAFLIKTPGKANLEQDFTLAAWRFGAIPEVYCTCALTCTACGGVRLHSDTYWPCAERVGARVFAKLLGSGRIWLTEEDSRLRKCSRTRPPLIPARACVRTGALIGAESDG